MRLKLLKLAGFKSFVDPTSVDVPGQRVGVVGPNGCGKSNIIDAVRWVLGESKASELRGESMQDVIFNGSADRKPAVRASVELVFDNTAGRIGGAWSAYTELAVRRLLTRDGQSTYLINGQTVRRKDVHDLFLGTGLGPRAYAIIGQGTVSRIIEARPEDLRIFLEEAAGVSRYKERRRETEHRLASTRENLTRVEDILRELSGQIEKLEQQAEVAIRYREFEQLRGLTQSMLWLVKRDDAVAEQGGIERQMASLGNEIEALVADQRMAERRLEETRAAHFAAGDAVHQAQGAYYHAAAEVTRIEAEIRFVIESRTQIQERLESLNRQIAVATERSDTATLALAQSALEGAAAQERLDQFSDRLEAAREALPAAESAVRAARAALDQARERAAEVAQALQVSATRQRALEDSLHELRARGDRLRETLAQVGPASRVGLDPLRAGLEEAELYEAVQAARVQEIEQQWLDLDTARGPAQDALRDALARLAQVDARIQALRQVQERVQSSAKTVPWLRQHGLDSVRRLWQCLRIEPGWENAIEAVLRERVQALEAGRFESLAGMLEVSPPAKVGFFVPGAPEASESPAAPASLRDWTPLIAQVHVLDPGHHRMLTEWLRDCYCATSSEQALRDRALLPCGAQFVLPNGHTVGRHGIQLYAQDAEQDGQLARHQEIESLAREHRALELIADECRAVAARAEASAAHARSVLAQERETLQGAVKRAAGLRLELERLTQRVAQAEADRARLQAELTEIELRFSERGQERDQEVARFESLDLALADRQEGVETERSVLDALLGDFEAARDRIRLLELDEREAGFSLREIDARRRAWSEQIATSKDLIESGSQEAASLTERLTSLSDEAARVGLQQALEIRVDAEQRLTEARVRLDALTATLREIEAQRLACERAQEPLRQRLTELQLKEQAVRLAMEQYAEQLRAAQVDEDVLRARFSPAPRAAWLQAEVTRLAQAVAALGAVNLAALDELAQARERHGFLSAQSADLNHAIQTLEDAIRKIDRETRDLLQDTFNQVNAHFGTLFPELFGGGEARLVLTGDEILDSGVTVVAQPPGKRNQSVHLLSGGEKALTAIALVFAMFQLNPAPFCLLDEVDAPLDDANTERYCAMVKRMSTQTQFLFITHSKITMELAQQLVGVTMQERGVSRIVAVDLDAASGFAKAA